MYILPGAFADGLVHMSFAMVSTLITAIYLLQFLLISVVADHITVLVLFRARTTKWRQLKIKSNGFKFSFALRTRSISRGLSK
jgi:hypothetical protein